MAVVCLGTEARLQKAPELSPGTTFELRRPGDPGSGAGLSPPSDHSKFQRDPEVALHLASSHGNRKARKPFLFLSRRWH